MKSIMKAVFAVSTMFVVGAMAGCGGSGSGSAPQSSSAGSTGAVSGTYSTGTASAQLSAGAALYASNCAGCHGDIAASSVATPTDSAAIQAAIAGNVGGMGMFSTLKAADVQQIADALNNPAAATATPAPTVVDGAALYAANCAGCHGPLATSGKKGITLARLQAGITNNIGGMGTLAGLSSVQQQAIVTVLNPATTPVPTPTPTPTPTPSPSLDGPTLYTANCAGCHGALATSSKRGTTLARLQGAITGNVGNMGYLSTLSSAQLQAIVTALAPATTTPTPTPTPTPTTDGATLYAANCASCHGALASSTKAGATAARTQTAINGNVGGMGFLSTLTSTQVSAIATALAVVTPPTTPPVATCGSCHAIPPVTGKHTFHKSRATCASCHGTGYSTTAVNAATHNNGVKNLTTTIGWNATSRSCSNSCHGSKSW